MNGIRTAASSAENVSDHTQPSNSSSDVEKDPLPSDGLEPTRSGSLYFSSTISLPREILLVTVVCCAQLTTQAGLGQVLGILKIIADDFDIHSPGEESWLIAAYSLTVGSFILISGRLGDVFGYKKMLIIGYLWYSLWSLVCGLSVYRGSFMFTFARALQGIGPSILLPNGLAVLGASYPSGHRKNMVFSLFGACAPGGCILGAALAGVFAEFAWWPWTFFVFSIGLLILAILAIYVVPAIPPYKDPKTLTFKELIVETDIIAGMAGVTGLILINVAWNQAPIAGWTTPYVYVLLILGFLVLSAFLYVEFYQSKHPLLPLHVLNSNVGFVLTCMAFGWGCFGIWSYYVWIFCSRVLELSPLLVIAWFSPVVVAGAVAAVCTGLVLGRIGPAWTMLVAMSAFLTGSALFAFRPTEQIYWAQMFLCTIITPWGMDMSFPAATLILSDSVPRQHQGVAASLVNTVVNYSISLALGFAGTAEVYLSRGTSTKEDLEHGYRVALYLGVGLAGLGWLTSITFLAKTSMSRRRTKD
ncbi:major facilitator superfamily-domain-containing protein [Microdochium trichocladiopsis]|uniref:Major facilitator superfamily-domain-containing protein n=1 Tax=Microdochium trichocladiopsis TaxID=1682393 RepID=A0A9P8Y2W0_9PEZI|nr:major facilitator superfamily-domain-containing protein [Microdochium trichocladiopsis]KAH7026168.1 major facilitator superfamily-domain-containing protein [Microdochium trichocladiopsis]